MIEYLIADNNCLSFIVFYAAFTTKTMLKNINKSVLSLSIISFKYDNIFVIINFAQQILSSEHHGSFKNNFYQFEIRQYFYTFPQPKDS